MISDLPFEIRRALVRGMGQHLQDNPLDVATRDQVGAAAREIDGHWRKAAPQAAEMLNGTLTDVPAAEAGELAEMLSAAVMACTPCIHLRRGITMPSAAQLPVHRLVCGRCAQTKVSPAEDESDRCDVCGSGGHEKFVPFIMRMGPMVVAGDAGSCCAPAFLRHGPVADRS